MKSLIRAGSGCLPADVSLGSVLWCQAKTVLRRGHICRGTIPSLVSINSQWAALLWGRWLELDPVLFHSACMWMSLHLHFDAEKAQMCAHKGVLQMQEKKKQLIFHRPTTLSATPFSSLESYCHKTEITSPLSNYGERKMAVWHAVTPTDGRW